MKKRSDLSVLTDELIQNEDFRKAFERSRVAYRWNNAVSKSSGLNYFNGLYGGSPTEAMGDVRAYLGDADNVVVWKQSQGTEAEVRREIRFCPKDLAVYVLGNAVLSANKVEADQAAFRVRTTAVREMDKELTILWELPEPDRKIELGDGRELKVGDLELVTILADRIMYKLEDCNIPAVVHLTRLTGVTERTKLCVISFGLAMLFRSFLADGNIAEFCVSAKAKQLAKGLRV